MKPTADILASIIEEVRPLTSKGIVADYIPALAKVPSDKLGIAVFTNQGEVITAGDAQEGFSIQSISKVLSLTLAMGLYQPDELWSRVGKEPSGQAFNSLIQLEMEQGIPRNPFINLKRDCGVRHAAKSPLCTSSASVGVCTPAQRRAANCL